MMTSQPMIEVDLVEPLRANVGLLAGCLRHHGFVEKDVWTKGPATVRLLQMALGRTKWLATFPSLGRRRGGRRGLRRHVRRPAI